MPRGQWLRAPGRNWTPDKLLQLADLLAEGETDAAIARIFGKTVTAVRLARKRHGLPSRRKLLMTQRAVEAAMGIPDSGKAVAGWIKRGWLRARVGERVGRHRERYVTREALYDFLADPRYWHVWRPERIRDAQLRLWARELRLDNYIRIGEAAQRLGVGHSAVNCYINAGLLPARRWGNWWVRESDVAAFTPPCERSKKGMALRWTHTERRTLARMRRGGASFRQIAETLGRSPGSVYKASRVRA